MKNVRYLPMTGFVVQDNDEYEDMTMNEYEHLTRAECIERLTAAGFSPANWALTSFETVELNRLREYVEALEED